MNFLKDKGAIYLRDESGKKIAQITYSDHLEAENVWNVDSTFVDESLRGQGVAEKLVDALADEARQYHQQLNPVCSYVVKLFERKPEKYGDVMISK